MDKFLYGCIYLSAAIAVSVLLMIICYVTVRGIGSVSLEFLTTVTSARKGTVGIAGNIVNTLYIIMITLVIATPIGVGSAIYLNEYAKPGKIVRIIEFTTETLCRYPIDYFRTFRKRVFWNNAETWLFSADRCSDFEPYDPATDHAKHAGSSAYGSGFLPERSTWHGSNKMAHDPYNPASVCHARHHHRSDSGDRTYRRRISSPALYGRKRLSAPESGRMAFQDPAAGRNFDDPAVS